MILQTARNGFSAAQSDAFVENGGVTVWLTGKFGTGNLFSPQVAENARISVFQIDPTAKSGTQSREKLMVWNDSLFLKGSQTDSGGKYAFLRHGKIGRQPDFIPEFS